MNTSHSYYNRLKRGGIFYLLTVLIYMSFLLGVPTDDNDCTICIPQMPGRDAYSEPRMTMAKSYIGPSDTLVIQVDKNPPVTVNHQKGARITGLSYVKTHLLAIKRDGNVIVSFRFNFEKKSSRHLCLRYYKGYGNFDLKGETDCKCKDEKKGKKGGKSKK